MYYSDILLPYVIHLENIVNILYNFIIKICKLIIFTSTSKRGGTYPSTPYCLMNVLIKFTFTYSSFFVVRPYSIRPSQPPAVPTLCHISWSKELVNLNLFVINWWDRHCMNICGEKRRNMLRWWWSWLGHTGLCPPPDHFTKWLINNGLYLNGKTRNGRNIGSLG